MKIGCGNRGKIRSQEVREKMGKSKAGKPKTAEHRQKIREALEAESE
jgi:hypothetical protein